MPLPVGEKIDDMCICLDTKPQRHGQTDVQTELIIQYRAVYSSASWCLIKIYDKERKKKDNDQEKCEE